MARERRPEDFGSQLREARERRGVSLRTIADVTRISVAALEGLERNDLSRLPGGIFSRAFVRAYAVEIGLDPDSTVDDFVRFFPDDSVTDGHPAAVRARIIDDVNEIRRRRLPRLVWLLIGLVPVAAVALALVFGWPGRRLPLTTSTSMADRRSASSPCLPPFRVELRANANASLSYAVDGAARQDVVLPAMSRRSFQASRDLDLRVSDGGAVELLINGVSQPIIGAGGAAAVLRITDFCAAPVVR